MDFKDAQDLAQKFLADDPANLMTPLGPRVREENVHPICTCVGQKGNDVESIAMQNGSVPKAKQRNFSPGPLHTLALALQPKKIRDWIPPCHLHKKSSLVTTHVDLKGWRTDSLPAGRKQIRLRFGGRMRE
jgi:hypothetical protein